jgi:hypothetical protein
VIDAAATTAWSPVAPAVDALAAGLRERQPDRLAPDNGRSSEAE